MISLPHAHIQDLCTTPLDFNHLMDEIPMGILILDPDRRVIHLNRFFEALSGISADRAFGVPCWNILRSAACITQCPLQDMHGKNRSVSCKSDMINMDRQKLPVRLTLAPLLDRDGKKKGYIETVEDLRVIEISDREKDVAYSFANIIGRSAKMEKIFQTLPMLAQSETSILITGETGTGKDMVAEAIHQTSGRSAGPFVKINCGALPETLLESELFGHHKGAFTGAVENKPGRFKLAHNGTIFLTEIGDLPLSLQVKLLTFLDDKIIYPLGATQGFNVNVRIIAATHRDLEKMVNRGRFRKDLLFRLNVARIHLPPLREREGDIRLLLDHFLVHYARLLDKSINGFSQGALMQLMNYGYEGNIRELKNIVEYAVNVAVHPMVEPEDLPAYLFDLPVPAREKTAFPADLKQNRPHPEPVEPSAPAPSGIGRLTWPSVERDMILDALKQTRGKKAEAARILGWGRSTLWRKIKRLEIDP